MSSILNALEPIARAAAAGIVNALWEDATIFLVVALVLRSWHGLNAATRYAVWFIALTAAIVVPVLTAVSTFQSLPTPNAIATPVNLNQGLVTNNAASHGKAHSADVQVQPSTRSRPQPRFSFSPLHVEVPDSVVFGLIALWGLAVLMFFARLIIGLVKLERLKKNALPLPIEHRASFAYDSDAARGWRDVRLCVSDETEVPVAVGLFDSMILIPQHLLESLSPKELEQVCLHEIAHLRRVDDWMNLFQRLATALTWFSPGIYAIAHWLDLEREVACDDNVVAETGAVRPYAQCLTRMAEITAWPHPALAAPGVFVTRRGISERVERLLRAGRTATQELSFTPTAIVIALLVFLGLGMRAVAPTAAAPCVTADTQIPLVSPTPDSAPAGRVVTTKYVSSSKPVRSEYTKTYDVASSPPPEFSAVSAPGISEVHAPGFSAVQRPGVSEVHAPGFTAISRPGLSEVHFPGFSAISAPGISEVQILGFTIGKHVPEVAGNAPTPNVPTPNGCTACNLAGANWSGRDVRGENFAGTNFAGAQLANTNFSNANLTSTNFSGTDLHGASFRGASLTGCNLSDANLHGVDFTGAKVYGCQFSGTALDGSQARDILVDCSGCDLSYQNLSNANLSGLRLSGDNFSNTNFTHADFTGAYLTGVNLAGAKLDGAKFAGATLIGCDLSGVDSSRVDLSQARLIGVNLSK